MILNRNTVFEFAWRLSVLALPWQTRFFWDAQILGWPWEQGRMSFYASWIPILLTIILFLFRKASLGKGGASSDEAEESTLRHNSFWLIAALGACTVIASPTPITAAAQWWVQIILLAAFFVTLLRAEINSRKVIFWFVIALIPHALLAIWQFASQTVIGSSLLGMSSQYPIDLGVSVVQTNFGRFLRAYGGFPHPNILGGWMAVGLLTTIISFPLLRGGKDRPRSAAEDRGIWAIECLFTLALFYSFSRSAWLATAVGFAVLFFMSFLPAYICEVVAGESIPHVILPLRTERQDDRRRLLSSLAIPVILFATLTFIHRDLVLTRVNVTSSRIEQRSVTSRVQSLKNGVEVFRSNLLFGTGPNSELPALVSLKKLTTSPSPLEPPHMVWLMILVNFGIVGSLFIAGFGLYLLRTILNKWNAIDTQNKTLIITLVTCQLILVTLDHYPWSLWSGQVLTFVVLFIFIGSVPLFVKGDI